MGVEHLTLETFKQKVFDFEANSEWMFEGSEPAIIDFYANWCGPCKMISPILEELSSKYGGKISIYKINTEQEEKLSLMFGIQSIPAILFVPLSGKPQMVKGAIPKQAFEEAISDIFGIESE